MLKAIVGLATCGTLLCAQAAWAAGVVGTGSAASCTDAALNGALAGGGLVTFNCGPAAAVIDISTGTGTKIINSDTTIDGAGVITISGGNQVRVFFVNTGITFTAQSLTIANGNIPGYEGGGGIFNRGGTAIVDHCTVSDNTAAFGAAISDYGGGTVTISNSLVSGNSAVGGTGAVGGGIYSTNRLTITNSTFSGNTAWVGGGVYATGGLNISNSTFTGNVAGHGGGIETYTYAAGSTATITSSTFSGNQAWRFEGGGINNHGRLTVSNSTFWGNTTSDFGGGLYNYYGTVTLINSTFSGNSARFGGGIYNDGPMTVANTIIAHSPSGGNCGGGVADGGHNIEDGATCGFTGTSVNRLDPMLASAGLANNGGPTQTIALQSGSPAINAGDQSTCASPLVNNLDQRGRARPALGLASCSIGAYEYDSPGTADCCQCTTSCGVPAAGACSDCAVVVGAACQTAETCVLHTPTRTRTPTPTPTSTPTSTPTLTPALACVDAPRAGCHQPQRAAAISMNTISNKLRWKWLGSTRPYYFSPFGDPEHGVTAYHLCVYDTSGEAPSLAFKATVPAGGTCGAQPCWTSRRNRLTYANPATSADGVRTLTLQAGRTRASIVVSGKGENLHLPTSADGIFLLREFPEVIVQLQRSDRPECWESVFTSPAIHNTRLRFVDTTR